MRVDDVRYVLAVIKHGTLSAAAKELFVSKPGLSEAIRRVETDLGVQLFERSSRGMALTAAGEQLTPHLRATLKSDDDLRAAARVAARADDVTSLVIGTLLGYGASWLNDVAELEASSSAPFDISVEVTGWSDVTGGLTGGSVEASLIAGPTDHDDELEGWMLGHDTRVAVIAPQHPLAQFDTVTLQQLDAAGWIMPAAELQLDQAWYRYWGAAPERRGQALPTSFFECHDPAEMIVAVRSGKGAFTTLKGVGDQFALTELAIRPVIDLPPCPIRLCVRQSADRQHLADAVTKIAADLRAVTRLHVSHPASEELWNSSRPA